MPTFPLLDLDPPHADAWHAVTAPGGYEWWYFDAEDRVNHRQLVVIFYEGFTFDPAYLRADARFRRNPTRQRPAVPGDFPGIDFTLYENGRVRAKFSQRFPAGQFAAARDRLAVTIGHNAIESSAAAIDVKIVGAGTGGLADTALSGQLRFEPRAMLPLERQRLVPNSPPGTDHYWQLANPFCDVSATLQLGSESIVFRGRGYHDHHYGTAPLHRGLRRWLRGRWLGEESANVFQLVEPLSAEQPAQLRLWQIDANRIEEVILAAPPQRREQRTAAGLTYPDTLNFGSQLCLSAPRLMDASPFRLRLQYAVRSGDQTGRALCEIVRPKGAR